MTEAPSTAGCSAIFARRAASGLGAGRAGDLENQNPRGLRGHERRQLRRAPGVSTTGASRVKRSRASRWSSSTTAGNPTIRFTFVKGDNLGSSTTMFLVGDTGVEQTFGQAPNVIDPDMEIDPAGGAACWNVGDTPVDCVSWGAFTGEAKLQAYSESNAGNPAVPGRHSRRQGDQTDDRPQLPHPARGRRRQRRQRHRLLRSGPGPAHARNWPTTETENCRTRMRDGDAGRHDDRREAGPRRQQRQRPFQLQRHRARRASNASSTPRRATRPARAAAIDYTGLADGPHLFEVRALNGNGFDKTPAALRVDRRHPGADELFAQPPPGAELRQVRDVRLRLQRAAADFLCGLDSAPSTPCGSGIRLTSLSTGSHTFNLAAVDPAGNVQAVPTSYTWSVNADAPRTTIDSMPANPSASTTAAFTYHANRPDAVFECSIDGAAFSSCPSGGATYTSLAKGTPHLHGAGDRLRRRRRGEPAELLVHDRRAATAEHLQEGLQEEKGARQSSGA